MVTLTATIKQLSSLWVFEVYDNSDRLLYIGCERLRTIPTLRELKRRALSALPDSTTLRIELITSVESEQEGFELVEQLRAVSMPQYGKPTPRQAVQCVQTGQVYDNARQAATALGVNYSYLHQHLKGRPHFNNCKGMTFKYYDGADGQ